ncbi:membrane protein [Streptomyces sp. L-9-10]|uniref:chaplin n=1 Tax=Streptomyces sp. L-9-10 TaxID=1478131 RepID=UPI00101D08AB|nr:chaplin [Streptomyces sp. L-9-10]RYJ31067.1 membrane protein [Streptomyces sp. L-9-10]
MRDLISKGLLTAAAASSVLSMSSGYAHAVGADGAAVGSPGVLSGNNIQVPVEIPVNVCGNTVDPIGVLNPVFGNACVNSTSGPQHAAHPAPAPHSEPAPHSAPAPHADPAPHAGPPAQAAPPAHATRPAPQADDAVTPPAPPHSHAPHHGAPGHASPGGYHDEAASSTHASAGAVGSPGVLTGNVLEAVLDIPLNICGNSVDLIGVLNPAFGNLCVNGTPQAPHGTPGTPGSPEAPETATPPDDRAVDPAGPATQPRTPAPRGSSEAILPASSHLTTASDEFAQLASTGSDLNLLAMGAASAGLLLGGGILYRRSTAASRV